MDLSIQPIATIGSAVVLLLTMVYYNRGLDAKIDDTRHSLYAKIDDTRQSLDAKIDDTRQALDTKIDDTREALDSKIDDTRQALDSKIDDTSQALDAKIDDVRRELKSDIASVEEKADRANQYHIEIRGDLKALTEKVDCIQKQVDSIERRIA